MSSVKTTTDILLKPQEWNEMPNALKTNRQIQNTSDLLSKGIVVYSCEKSIYLINHSKANVRLAKGSVVGTFHDTVEPVVDVQQDTPEETPEKPVKTKKPRKKAEKPKQTPELIEPVLEEQKVEIVE